MLMIFNPVVTTTLMSDRLVLRAYGLIFGFVVFGKPVMDRMVARLARLIPHWRENVILEK
jgi:uncharacterized protein YbjQ (UPF0145 family)